MTITKCEYSNLDHMFDFLNRQLFEGELPDLLFTYQYRGKYYGFYRPAMFALRDKRSRGRVAELALNPKMFVECDDLEIIQTIGHEMCHHWQALLGTMSRSGYHNKQFAHKMQSIGLMPSSTGEPGGKMTGQRMADYVIPNSRFERAAHMLIKSGYIVNFEAPITARDIRTAQPSNTQSSPTATVPVPGLDEPAPEHPNAKTTYICPCDEYMWGKPTLEVRCKKCGGDFEPVRKDYSLDSQIN